MVNTDTYSSDLDFHVGSEVKQRHREVLNVLDETDAPVHTAAEIANDPDVDITKRAALDRLSDLKKKGYVESRDAGQALVWWLAARSPADELITNLEELDEDQREAVYDYLLEQLDEFTDEQLARLYSHLLEDLDRLTEDQYDTLHRYYFTHTDRLGDRQTDEIYTRLREDRDVSPEDLTQDLERLSEPELRQVTANIDAIRGEPGGPVEILKDNLRHTAGIIVSSVVGLCFLLIFAGFFILTGVAVLNGSETIKPLQLVVTLFGSFALFVGCLLISGWIYLRAKANVR